LQLVIDRIIVHDGSLEIRHVIPLRSPPPGRESTADPVARLRSDRMNESKLVRGHSCLLSHMFIRPLPQRRVGKSDWMGCPHCERFQSI
jgi:hypothetical protein